MGDFPEGEAPGAEPGAEVADAGGAGADGADPGSQAGGGTEAGGEGAAGDAGTGGAGEPGFEVTVGSDALPSMVDIQPVLPGLPGVGDIVGTIMGDGPEGSGQQGSGQQGSGAAGNSDGLPGQQGGSGTGNGQVSGGAGTGRGGFPGAPAGSGNFPGRQGPLTPGEQVAILDAELESGMGDFDAMILEEQAAQRRAARENSDAEPVQTASAEGAGGDSSEGGYGREMGGSGGSNSQGGGMGGIGGGSGMPQNTAKYPPPADIPNGNDDDVVARQLREAAMREADPAVREKLWVEYRKYKGIKAP